MGTIHTVPGGGKKIKKMPKKQDLPCVVKYTSLIKKKSNLAKSVEGFLRNLVLKTQKSHFAYFFTEMPFQC